MNRLFDQDSPIIAFLSRLADLIWLNLLTLLASLPIVTAGAALTALHYVTIQMVRKEDGYLTRSFWKSFRRNFLQATAMWLLMLFLLAAAGADFYLLSGMEGGAAFLLRIGLCVVLCFFLCGSVYWFALLSKFDNSVPNTIRNACLIGVLHFPKSICILVLYGAFLVLYGLFALRILPLIFLLGIALPVYLASYLFSDIFKKLEPPEEIGQSV